MRQWRVGSFSMALVLVLLGIVLLVAQYNELSAVELLVNWWPAALILLGIEILLAGYFSKEDHPRLKYDFFAVLMVVFVGLVSLGIYTLTSSGMMDMLNHALAASNYAVELPEERLAIPENIKKIVVERVDSNLTIRSQKETEEVVYFGQAQISAASFEEAEEIASYDIFKSKLVGDTMYLQLEGFPRPGGFEPQGILSTSTTLILPGDRKFEFAGNNSYGSLDLVLEHLENNWFIDHMGPIRVKLDEHIALEVRAVSEYELGGNVDWELEERKETTGQGKEKIKGTLKIGEGGGLLQLFSGHQIIIDQAGY